MIAQIVAAALINECQVLSHPSSTGSIPTDGGKEDHVSMGMTGALKLRQIVENAERVVAIELMCAAQGLEFRRPLRPSREVERRMPRCGPWCPAWRRTASLDRRSRRWQPLCGRRFQCLVCDGGRVSPPGRSRIAGNRFKIESQPYGTIRLDKNGYMGGSFFASGAIFY